MESRRAVAVPDASARGKKARVWRQLLYTARFRALAAAHGRSCALALVGKIAARILPAPTGVVEVHLFGAQLRIGASHHLPFIVAANPMWSRPLIHAVGALPGEAPLVVDVGANVGDTVLMIEGTAPGRCRYVCIEPDDSFFSLCQENLKTVPMAELHHVFVGERGTKLAIAHGAPGTATTRAGESGAEATPLDEVIAGRKVDLIKVDTDGLDYAVLRSAVRTVKEQRPALFFEWDPHFWRDHGEDPAGVFEFLADLGYHRFSLFTDAGFFYCDMTPPVGEAAASLVQAALSRRGIDNLYFDVLAADDEVCRRTTAAVCSEMRAASLARAPWFRVQPRYWATYGSPDGAEQEKGKQQK